MSKNVNPEDKEGRKPLSASFVTGAIALVFLIIGFQTAVFIHRAAVLSIMDRKDHPDTVFIFTPSGNDSAGHGDHGRSPASVSGNSGGHSRSYGYSSGPGHSYGRSSGRAAGSPDTVRHYATHTSEVNDVRERFSRRTYESFHFNPNEASVEELMRLGFSAGQARSIDNYRKKGGRFHRKSDFLRSYVVADSVYERLEPYIDIPLLDINAADSASFDALPGIGPYFAARMVAYREELGGYSFPEQLMDIYNFTQEKFDGLSDLIEAGPTEPYRLWTLPEDSLRLHPYIRNRAAAHGIVIYRENNPKSGLTVEALAAAGILPQEQASKLARCRIAGP